MLSAGFIYLFNFWQLKNIEWIKCVALELESYLHLSSYHMSLMVVGSLNPHLIKLLCFFKWNLRSTHTHTHKVFPLVPGFCGCWNLIDFIASWVFYLHRKSLICSLFVCALQLILLDKNLEFELFEYFWGLTAWI